MRKSKHVQQRMSQRGITQPMIHLTLMFGSARHDNKYVLGKKAAAALLDELRRQECALRRLIAKSGSYSGSKDVLTRVSDRASGRSPATETGDARYA